MMMIENTLDEIAEEELICEECGSDVAEVDVESFRHGAGKSVEYSCDGCDMDDGEVTYDRDYHERTVHNLVYSPSSDDSDESNESDEIAKSFKTGLEKAAEMQDEDESESGYEYDFADFEIKSS